MGMSKSFVASRRNCTYIIQGFFPPSRGVVAVEMYLKQFKGPVQLKSPVTIKILFVVLFFHVIDNIHPLSQCLSTKHC